ncbi:hypothetical protein jhhlp_001128 [Lomentospora prolificans]|uniref:Dipeptidyl-peptidase V n=1 Tax=Lomentospora prolificans TaxID=41688 RepID=A0A2N3NHC0_9PEZI|nr:hypothetical protein jhhlp_001128 [Lomentospora prolificans]
MEPKFSHDGRKVAFVRMRNIQYEADKTRLMMIPNIDELDTVQEFYKSVDGKGGWDYSPSGIEWSVDDSELYVSAEKHGRVLLWKLPSSPALATDLPEPIYKSETITGFRCLSDSDPRLLITTSSLIDSACYSILDPRTNVSKVLSSATKHGKSLGLSRSQCSDFWFTGCDGRRVHAWVMRPSSFTSSKKYPLAFLIHGGPQGAWLDSWSTRWNPAIFAEAGYVAVMINPTGSTGYGQEFTDRIQNEWGGRPYIDLEKCWEHIETTMPYVDVENGVALGASYGGYMISRKFRALVCHDGVFSTLNQWSTEELFFPIREFGGPIWECRDTYEKWDPARFTDQWATPMLVIHNELDYRLPISEGLAMFNVLQARKIPSRFVMFPDENHWVLKHENSLVWHREVLGFINKFSGIDKDVLHTTVSLDRLNLDD